MIKARVTVTLKNGVLDPQGKAIEGAVAALGIDGLASCRQGKVFDLELDISDQEQAKSNIEMMCEQLLTNSVIEDYAIEI